MATQEPETPIPTGPMADQGPEDPITELAEMAVHMHELFEAYREAGFTEQQALYLIGRMVTPRNGTD